MTFEELWDGGSIGEKVRVSNGRPRPNGDGFAFKVWRSHNFEGKIVDWIQGPPRAIRIELPEENGAVVAYDVSEDAGNTFDRA